MSWKKERDALIAQTMAFVQSVTGRGQDAARLDIEVTPAPARPDLAARNARSAPEADAPIEPVKPAEPPPSLEAPTPIVSPNVAGEMAKEIRARVAGFRAHQERFNREREEYFSKTLAKLKATLNEMPPPRPDE